jgi:hypothetical protein
MRRALFLAAIVLAACPAPALARGHHHHRPARHHRARPPAFAVIRVRLPAVPPAPPAPVDALALAQAAAAEYWGGQPCGGGAVSILYAPGAAMPTNDTGGVPVPVLSAFASFATPLGPDDYAADPATFTDCRVTINADQWPARDQRRYFDVFCGLIVHEYGHLFGHPDRASDSPASITYPLIGTANDAVAPCVRRYAAAGFAT